MSMLSNNNRHLMKLIFRRERIQIPVWFLGLISIILAVPIAFQEMYGTAADRAAMVITMKNPAMIAMVGPLYGTDNYTIGAMNTNMMLLFTSLAVAIMNIFFVVRHTRRDEELGRIEVIRSFPVSRLSSLSAAMSTAVLINMLLALLTTGGLTVLNIESMSFQGSLLFGVSLGTSGLLFAAIAALLSQLCITQRGATGYSFGLLGLMYMLRGVGDINSETLSRIVPLGLVLRTQSYTKNQWWPIPILLAIALAVTLLAFHLNAKRDMGQGFIPAKPGRKTASPLLQSPLGLSWRLLRGTYIAWIIGLFMLGASYGSIMGDLEGFLENNEILRQAIMVSDEYSMTELFITMLMSVIAMGATIPCLSILQKLRSEEKHNRTELLLSRSVSRKKLLSGYLLLSFLASFLMLFVSVLGLWSASASSMTTPIPLTSMLKAMLVYLPAVWIMMGFMTLLIGILPSRTMLTWIYLGFSFVVVYFGKIMQFPEWLQNCSPFAHIPELPVDEINYVTLLILTTIAIACIIIGYITYQKRDIQG
jgi:ABC-2 type transport system permease protein